VTERDSQTLLAEARDRHRGRSRGTRLATVSGGWLAGGASVLLLVPVPELGFPLLLLGLRLLALEYDWAARAYAPVARAWSRLKALPLKVKLGIGLAALALVAGLAWWLA
jgi:hypothetical protein